MERFLLAVLAGITIYLGAPAFRPASENVGESKASMWVTITICAYIAIMVVTLFVGVGPVLWVSDLQRHLFGMTDDMFSAIVVVLFVPAVAVKLAEVFFGINAASIERVLPNFVVALIPSIMVLVLTALAARQSAWEAFAPDLGPIAAKDIAGSPPGPFYGQVEGFVGRQLTFRTDEGLAHLVAVHGASDRVGRASIWVRGPTQYSGLPHESEDDLTVAVRGFVSSAVTTTELKALERQYYGTGGLPDTVWIVRPWVMVGTARRTFFSTVGVGVVVSVVFAVLMVASRMRRRTFGR